MAEVSLAVDVAAPADRVWRVAVDWPSQSRWMVLTDVRVTRGSGHQVGDRLVAFTGLGRLGFSDPMEITAYDAPHRVVVRHLGRVVRGSAAFEVIALDGGRARFVWTEWLELPLGVVGQAGFVVLRAALLWPLRRSLARFAELAGADSTGR